jgi:hypothetical protein
MNYNNNNIHETFEDIHRNWKWLDRDPERETTCWVWSKVSNNRTLINTIPLIIQKYWIKNIIDLWCWDINWIKLLFNYFIENNIKYTWLDVSETIISKASEKIDFETEYIKLKVWTIADIKGSNKKDTLIISKDVLVHLPNEIIIDTLNQSAQNANLILTTNFPNSWWNEDIELWNWRAVNLMNDIYWLKTPLKIIPNVDKSTKNIFPDKNMSLFNLKDF